MAGDDNNDLGAQALPTHLTVRFAPRTLPPGAVDLQDLSQFLTGLQRTLDAKVRYDSQVESIESERFRVFQFVVADVRHNSVECDIIFNLFSSNTSNTNNPSNTNNMALPFAAEVGSIPGARMQAVEPVLRVLERMPRYLKHYLRDFVAFLRNVTSSTPTPVSSQLLERAETGLKDMAQVGAKDIYSPEGITIRTGIPGERPVVFDTATRVRLLDLLEGDIEGDKVVMARGRVTALDIDQNSFRLQDTDRGGRVRCRYAEDQQDVVLAVATPPNLVQAYGVPHFRKGSDRTWPPLYLKVTDVIPMSTLWNLNQQAQ